MAWEFDNSRPIYLQIMEEFKRQIAAGELLPGDKISPVRELALQSGVNPNTMQRALSELEREGLIASNRTQGRYVTNSYDAVKGLLTDLANQAIAHMVSSILELGYGREEIIPLVTAYVKEME